VVPVVVAVVLLLKSHAHPKHPSASCLKYVYHCILLAAASPAVLNKQPIGPDTQLACGGETSLGNLLQKCLGDCLEGNFFVRWDFHGKLSMVGVQISMQD